MLNQGTNVTKRRAATEAKYNGINGLMTLLRLQLPIAHETKRQGPTGGDTRPMLRFKTTTTPKWTGFMPNSKPIGCKMGAKTIIAAIPGKKVPQINKARFRKKRIRILLLVTKKMVLMIF